MGFFNCEGYARFIFFMGLGFFIHVYIYIHTIFCVSKLRMLQSMPLMFRAKSDSTICTVSKKERKTERIS